MKIHRMLLVLTPLAAYLGYGSGPFVNFAYTSGTIIGALLSLLALMAVVRIFALKEQAVAKEYLKDSLFLGIMVSLGIGIATYQSQDELAELRDDVVSILERASEAELEYLDDTSALLPVLERRDELVVEPNSPVSELTSITNQIQRRGVEFYNSYAEALNGYDMESLVVFENGFGETEFIARMSIISDLKRLTIKYKEGIESVQEFSLNLANNSKYLDSETKRGLIAGINESRLTEIQFQILALDIEAYDLVEMLTAHMLQNEWEADDDLIYFDADEDINTYNQILTDMTATFDQSSQLTLQANRIRQEVIGNLNDL